jgi:hypothetical protein
LSSEISHARAPTLWCLWEGNIIDGVIGEPTMGTAETHNLSKKGDYLTVKYTYRQPARRQWPRSRTAAARCGPGEQDYFRHEGPGIGVHARPVHVSGSGLTMQVTNTSAVEAIHRLLFRALLEIRSAGHDEQNKVVFHLADLFHTIVLEMQRAAEGRCTYEEVFNLLEEKAKEKGLDRWLNQGLAELKP